MQARTHVRPAIGREFDASSFQLFAVKAVRNGEEDARAVACVDFAAAAATVLHALQHLHVCTERGP